MPEIVSADGRYMLAVQGDGNVVVYDRGRPVWDKWTHEANEGPGTPDQEPQPETQEPRPEIVGRLIQVTNEPGILNRGYAYWPQAWVSGLTAFVFAGHADGGVRFYTVDLASGQVSGLGAPVPYAGTGEGWYWTLGGEVVLLAGPRMRRVSPLAGTDTVVFDISDRFPGCRLWQAHSSDDGQTHSATVQRIVSDGPYPNLGTVVWRHGQMQWFPSPGALDESQIDASGEFLLIKEGDANIVVTLDTGVTKTLSNAAGALGHSDCGSGFAVGEDDQAGACVWLDLQSLARRELFKTWNMGELSIRGGRCLLSDATDRVISLLDMETGARQVLLEHGMRGTGYEYQTHANLSPCGRVGTFVSNRTGRFELFLIVL